jgi:hypothetical protein
MTLNVDEFPAGRKFSDPNLSVTPVFIGGTPAASVPPAPTYVTKEVKNYNVYRMLLLRLCKAV